jgi:hypothetical protein
MQIPKSFILCAVISVCPILGRADTEAQIKAREALRAKLAEIENVPATNAPAVRATQPPPTVVAPTPTRAPGTSATPSPRKRLDPETRRSAEERLREKIRELEQPSGQPTISSASDSQQNQDAREQLRRKVAELEKQRPAPASATTSSTPSISSAPISDSKITEPPASKVIVENDEVAKVREALRKKIAELEVQKPAPAAPTVVAPTPEPAPVVTAPEPVRTPRPAPVVTTAPPAPAPVVTTPTPAPIPVQPTPAPAPVPVVTIPPAPAPAPPVVTKPAAPTPAVPSSAFPTESAIAKTSESDAIVRAREEVRRKLAEMESQPPASQTQPKPIVPQTKPAPVVSTPQPKPIQPAFETVPGIAPSASPITTYTPAASGKDRRAQGERNEAEFWATRTPASFNTEPAPAISISATKAEKLGELLRRYKADEVTPEQYHKERAKILAEP